MSHDQTGDTYELLRLMDEDGTEVAYPILDVFPYAGDDYVVLLDTGSPEADQVILLRILPASADEAEQYEGVGDDELMYAVFDEFVRLSEAAEET